MLWNISNESSCIAIALTLILFFSNEYRYLFLNDLQVRYQYSENFGEFLKLKIAGAVVGQMNDFTLFIGFFFASEVIRWMTQNLTQMIADLLIISPFFNGLTRLNRWELIAKIPISIL